MFLGPLHLRKIIQDIWLYKTRTLLIVLTIAIGVFAVGTIARTWLLLSRELATSYTAVNPTSAVIVVEGVVTDDIVKAIQNMPDVGQAEGRYRLSSQLVGPNDSRQLLRLTTLSDFEHLQIDKISPESGAWPPQDRTVLIERSSLALMRSDVQLPRVIGDQLIVKRPNDKLTELTFSGVVHDLTEFPTAFSNIIYGYITPGTLKRLTGVEGYNRIHIVVAKNPLDVNHIEYVADLVADRLEAQRITVANREIPIPRQHPLSNIVQSVLFILGVLSFFSLLLSAFLVINTVSAILARQVRHIGIMETIGAGQGNIILIYMGMVLLFGVFGLIIALPLATIAGQQLTDFMANLLNFKVTDFGLPLWIYILDVFAGIGVPLVVASFPIRKGASITIREAVSDSGNEQAGQFGQSMLDQLLNRLRQLPSTLLYTIRNIFRHKTRLAITLTALTLASTFFMVVISVRASLLLTIDDIAAYWSQDIKVFFGKSYRLSELERATTGIPGVVRTEGRLEKNAIRIRPDGGQSADSIAIFGVQPESGFLNPTLIEGRWLQPDDTNALVVNIEMIKAEPDIAIGETIKLDIDNHEAEWQVVGIVTGQLIGGGEILDPIMYTNYPFFAQTLGQTNQVNRILVETERHNRIHQAEVAQILKIELERAGISTGFTELNADIRTALGNLFNVLVSLMVLLALLLAVVGGLGLMGMMSLSVLERTRELGVVHAIGGNDLIVLQIVITEGVFIGILSWLLGVILAIPLSQVLSNAIGQIFLSVPLTYTMSIGGMLLWLVIVILLSALASYLPAQNASNMSIREALSHE